MSNTVKNIMERMVEEKLDQMLPMLGCCTCETCRTDVLCYALNRLKPRYVSTEQGELLSRVDSVSIPYETAIVTEIVSAAEIVKKNPHHSK